MAAGLSLSEQNLVAFQRTFEELCAARLGGPEDYLPKLYIDGRAGGLGDITPDLIRGG